MLTQTSTVTEFNLPGLARVSGSERGCRCRRSGESLKRSHGRHVYSGWHGAASLSYSGSDRPPGPARPGHKPECQRPGLAQWWLRYYQRTVD